MPEMPDVVPGTPVDSSWGNDIRSRTIQRYDSAANRDALVPVPVEGDLAYLRDSNTVTIFNGAWVILADQDDFLTLLPLDGSRTMTGDINMGVNSIINLVGVFGSAGAAFGVQPGAGHPLELRDGAGIQRWFINETVAELRAADTSVIFEWDGGVARFLKPLNMGSNPIVNLLSPTNPTDAVNLVTLTDAIAGQPLPFLPLAGGSMGGVIDANGNQISNLPNAVAPGDAVSLSFGESLWLTQAEGDGLYLPIGTPLFTQADADLLYVALPGFTQGDADLLYLPIGTPLFTEADADLLYLPIGADVIGEAPNDGQQYGRQSLGWTPVQSGGVPEAPSDDFAYLRANAAWQSGGASIEGHFNLVGDDEGLKILGAFGNPLNSFELKKSSTVLKLFAFDTSTDVQTWSQDGTSQFSGRVRTADIADTSGGRGITNVSAGGAPGDGGFLGVGAAPSGLAFAGIKGSVISGGGNASGDMLLMTRRADGDANLAESARITREGWLLSKNGSYISTYANPAPNGGDINDFQVRNIIFKDTPPDDLLGMDGDVWIHYSFNPFVDGAKIYVKVSGQWRGTGA